MSDDLVKIAAKPWVRKWHVSVLYWTVYFPVVMLGRAKEGFQLAVEETRSEIDMFDFKPAELKGEK